jgi:uncharacterized phage protein (TIGR02218 family)
VTQHAFIAQPLSYPAGQLGNGASISIRNNVTGNTALEISDGVASTSAIFLFDTRGLPDAYNQVVTTLSTSSLDMTYTFDPRGFITLTNNSGKQGNIVKTGDAANPPAFLIQNFTGNYLDAGTVTWITGQNAGVSMEMKTYDPNTSTVYLWLGMHFPITAGDTFYYYPGCDKTRQTCFSKFNNILNFRGEPDIPGLDAMLAYPGT